MRTRLVWLLTGAAVASVVILAVPALANTLSNEKASEKARKWAREEYNRDTTYKRVTRAYTSGCKRQKIEGTQDDDPHRVACLVTVRYDWDFGTPYLPNPVYKCVLVRKNHDNGNVKAGPGGGC